MKFINNIKWLVFTIFIVNMFWFVSCKNPAGGVIDKTKSEKKTEVKSKGEYVKVSFSKLDEYLKNKAQNSELNYIEVTDLIDENLGYIDGKLCNIINKNNKPVALKLSGDITKIGYYAFYNCANLKSIIIPESVKEIAEGSFNGCSTLEVVNIPETVTKIGNFAFYNCTNLKSIIIPESVMEIDYSPFEGCDTLNNITFKATETWKVYKENDKFSSRMEILPEKLLTNPKEIINKYKEMYWKRIAKPVGGYVFTPEDTWGTVPFSELDVYLANKASRDWVNHIEVTELEVKDVVRNGLPVREFEDDSTFISQLNATIQAYPSKKVHLKLKGNLFELKDMDGAFRDCVNLVALEELPKNVTNLNWCFEGCTSLVKAPVISSKVTDFTQCFRNCSSLTKVKLECKLKYDNTVWGVFDGCTNLERESIIVPKYSLGCEDSKDVHGNYDKERYAVQAKRLFSIKSNFIDKVPVVAYFVEEQNAHNYIKVPFSKLDSYLNDKTQEKYYISITGLDAKDVVGTGEEASELGKIIKKHSDKKICLAFNSISSNANSMHNCFRGCENLIEAKWIPESVKDISSCFEGCKALENVILENSLIENNKLREKETYENAFKDCEALKKNGAIKVTIGELKPFEGHAWELFGVTKDKKEEYRAYVEKLPYFKYYEK